MRTLYVVTHPQAAHHVERVVGGWYDSALTPAGEHDAGLIAASLRDAIPGDVRAEIYSSDLVRASRTASVIGERLQVVPVLDDRLREKSYGEAEGRPQDWLDHRFIAPPASGDRMNHDEGIVGAETRAVFAQRVYAAMDAIVASECEHQVVVTHGFAHTFVVAAWIKMPIESVGYVNFATSSGAISVLLEDDEFHNRQVVRTGSIDHLQRR